MTGAIDRPTMKNLKEADRRLPICFSFISNPSLHPSSRISAIGAFSMLPTWQPLPRMRRDCRNLVRPGL